MIRKIRRLLTMGPSEILWRVRRALTIRQERIGYRLGWYFRSSDKWRRTLHPAANDGARQMPLAEWWHQHISTRQEPAFLLNRDVLAEARKLYDHLFSDRKAALNQLAEKTCRGHFSFLGIDFRASDPIPWQRDPSTDRDWPANYHADIHIPFCDGTNNPDTFGDVKHVWELNRHEFLIACAKAYYLTGETRFARRVFQIILDWTKANPYLCGVNWAGPLEVAVRSLAWLWSYQFCRDWPGLTAEDNLRFSQSLYQHGTYLHRHIEVYTSPNNHLVGEATALYLLGSFFPEFDRSRDWQEHAWRILSNEPLRQFYGDGGSTEQAISYHHYCLGFFLLVVLTRRQQGLPVPKEVLDRLEAACNFSMWMTLPDGTVPRLGDTDDARSIRFEHPKHWDFRTFLCLGAILFQRPDFKSVAGYFSEDALWLLGRKGYIQFESLTTRPPEATSRLFSESGYAIMRSGWTEDAHHTCFDCGPIGLGLMRRDIPIFTHGHADLLAVNISAFGRPLLVDAGFYTYNGSPGWHRYTRDVQGHNSARVDGQSQARFHPANAWSCVSTPGPLTRKTVDDLEVINGSHDGFCGVPVRHRRALACRRNAYWLICDRFEGSGQHLVEIFFHITPGTAEPLAHGNGVQIMTDSGVAAVLTMVCPHTLRMELRHGQHEPEGGFVANSYGCRQPAPLIRFFGSVELPFSVSFVMVASDTQLDSADSVRDWLPEWIGRQCTNSDSFAVRVAEEGPVLGFRWDKDALRSTGPIHSNVALHR